MSDLSPQFQISHELIDRKRFAALARKKVMEVHYYTPRCSSLLNILDLHDAALGLRVLWVLHYGHV